MKIQRVLLVLLKFHNMRLGEVFRLYLNRQSLGDFTKMEGTQMEMFNFLWLILGHYLPLTPTKND